MLAAHSYEWVVEGDIRACFDEISHSALMDRVRRRIGDKRVLALVKAFLTAGILAEDGTLRDTDTGTPQGGILSPLLANVALSVLDEFVDQMPGGPRSTASQRRHRRRLGKANYRLVRYADDFLVLVSGTRQHADQVRCQVAAALAPMGLRLSEAKTHITHVKEGFDFLGWRIQRHRKRGTNRWYVYTYPAKKALRAIMAKVKTLCRRMDKNEPLGALVRQLNPMLRGWCAYFRPGVSSATFDYLDHYTWGRVVGWLRRKHHRSSWKDLRRRYWAAGGPLAWETRTLFSPGAVSTTRYRYRGAAIPTPWPTGG